MSRMSIIVAASALAWAQPAFAEEHDGAQIASAKIPMEAAVVAAQRHVQGRAIEAKAERRKDGRWVYEVEVRSGAKVFEVKVDAENGTVMKSEEDETDADGPGSGKGERD